MPFNEFWKIYPRRVGKLDAEKAFIRATRRFEVDEILEGAKKFAQMKLGEEIKFIPHPATWLNQGRWMDEYPDESKPSYSEHWNRIVAKQIAERSH